MPPPLPLPKHPTPARPSPKLRSPVVPAVTYHPASKELLIDGHPAATFPSIPHPNPVYVVQSLVPPEVLAPPPPTAPARLFEFYRGAMLPLGSGALAAIAVGLCVGAQPAAAFWG